MYINFTNFTILLFIYLVLPHGLTVYWYDGWGYRKNAFCRKSDIDLEDWRGAKKLGHLKPISLKKSYSIYSPRISHGEHVLKNLYFSTFQYKV